MPGIQLSEPTPATTQGWRPFALGFRPFFLSAGLSALLLMGVWLILWHAGFSAEWYYGRIGWHTHEMLFGFAVAVVAGFLLTAVPNWTGVATPIGGWLAALAGVWLAGRLLPWFPATPPLLLALVDLAFLPLLLLALLRPLWRGRNRVNLVFIGLIGLMILANLLIHGDALGYWSEGAWRGTQLMLDSLLLILVFVAGRVMPFFVERAVVGATPRIYKPLEWAGYTLFGALIVAHLLAVSPKVAAILALLLGVVQAVRLANWWHPGILRIPILWVLFAGYLWLVLGLLALAAAHWGWLPRTSANHLLTVGAVGILTLGMMARVGLGHTGRTMRSATGMTVAFVLLNSAVVVRVFGPLLHAPWWWIWYTLSGLLWIVAFALFLWIYTPILLRPRVDGQPG